VFYQIEAEGKTVAVMGSLNLRKDTEYPAGADLLVLPYNGWTDNYPPAVRVIRRLKPKHVLLDHYDESFPPFTRLRPSVSMVTVLPEIMIIIYIIFN
jgi:L-ascorbate metabolism protein UlaG (beta-lactamase superfamily)